MLQPRFFTLLVLLAGLIAATPAVAQDAPNALTNGGFEEAGDMGGAAGWTRGDPTLVKFVTEDDNRFCRIELPEKKAAIISQEIDLPTGTTAIDVSVRMRVKDLQTGEKAWNTGMVQYQFYNAAGERVGGWPKLMPGGDLAEWTKLENSGEAVPEGAVTLKVQCGVWGASGTFDYDDVTVTTHKADGPAPGSGPGDAMQFDPIEPRDISRTRAELSLNGDWQYMAARGAATKAPEGAWQVRAVPGTKGTDDRMWYQRTVRVPAGWSGRAVVLDVERVSTDATVYVDGKEAGTLNWPGGAVDLTDHIKPGTEQELRLLVVAVDDLKQVTQFMGYLDEPTQAAKLDHRGIIGDVALRSRPLNAHVADLLVQPSVREQRLGIDVELADLPKAGEVSFKAEMLDEQGQAEKTFTTKQAVVAGDSVAKLSFDWPDPRLWDYGQPNLYTLRLTVSGPGVDDVYAQRFGFREFWIEGRKFYLNGTEYKLRPLTISQYASGDGMTVDAIRKRVDQGFNYLEMWPANYTRRGSLDPIRGLPAVADEVGMPNGANVAYMNRVLRNWDDPALREQWHRIMEDEVRTYRKHPSVVMYAHTANGVVLRSDSDPWLLGQEDASVVQAYRIRRERVFDLIGQIKALHPQPVYAHHGGDNGDVHTSNMYLNFLPLQEREEWISYWAEHGDMPWMSCEFGLPLYATVMRGRSGYAHQGKSEPLLTEWAVRDLGPEAYAMEPARYREEVIAGRFKGDDPQSEYEPHIRWDKREQIIIQSPAFLKLMELYVPRTYRSFRGLGVTGGMVPWMYDDTPEIVTAVNGPALAWIAGPGDVPNQQVDNEQPLTDRTHHYGAGEQIAKQVVLINDHREPMPFKVEWRIIVGEQELASNTAEGELAVTETRMLPIEASLPTDLAAAKTDGRVVMQATIGEQTFEDTFAFRVWPKVGELQGVTVSAFDPHGDTSAALEAVGVQVTPWTEGQPAQPVAIIGRDALSGGNQVPGDIERFVREGGRLIVFTQDPQWIEHALHLRVADYSSRQAFVADEEHPIVAGLDAEDLSYWNGSATNIEGYPSYPQWEWTPKYGWKWGNRHTISAAPIEKPHRGGWTPIVEQEFDLAYTPLMELRYGRGLIVFNTFDVEARTRPDPAAQQLTRQLVQYAADAELAPRPDKVAYLGGDAGRATLDQLGVIYQTVDAPDESIGLLIVGGDVADGSAVRSYLEAGGHVVFLRREGATAPLGVELVQDEKFIGSREPAVLAEGRGLTGSDLRYRAASPAWVLSNGPGLTIDAAGQLGRMSVGEGVAVFAQLGPEALPAEEKRYLRYTRWRQTRALSQVLANMGAGFAQDQRFLALLKTPDHMVPLEGTWQFKPVNTLSESPERKWNAPKPMSDDAQRLVQPDASTAGFTQVIVPGYIEGYGDKPRWIDGEFVFRKAIDWPAYAAGKPAVLSVGRVDETETSFVNGQQVGHTKHWLAPRAHSVATGVIKPGENVIAVRVWDEGIHGGMAGEPRDLYLKVKGEDPGFYHPDYVSDRPVPDAPAPQYESYMQQWKVADNPYRYYRW